jgi:hypothetical protein
MATTAEKQAVLRRARETLCGRLDAGNVKTLDRDALDAWRAGMKRAREEEPPVAPIAPEPPALDWEKMQAWLDSHIGAAIEKERNWWLDELLPPLLAEVQDQSAIELSYDLRKLNAELAELRALIGEARALLAADRAARGIPGPVLDVPKPATPPN